MSDAASSVVLSPAQVRAIALRAQGLAEDTAPFGKGKTAVLKAVQHLGYVQVDAISVIQRAHHHVLWSRIPDYHPDMLRDLQSPEAAVYEYWNHASSILPTDTYRFSLPLMRKFQTRTHWCDETPELHASMSALLARVRKDGPLRISDVPARTASRGWTEGSSSSFERRALHELWMRGDLMIRSRHGIQKVFDLPERVLPAGTDVRMPEPAEAAEFHVRRSLRALGVARAAELHYLQDAASATIVRQVLGALVRSGEIVTVKMEGLEGPPLFALCSALEDTSEVRRDTVRFLSPFDNLTIQRKRLSWLFGFDFLVEIYVPPAKRKYGYFVLPILWGDQLIGRMDAKADRAENRLIIHNLVFEPTFRAFSALRAPFKKAVRHFMRFQGSKDVQITRTEPASIKLL